MHQGQRQIAEEQKLKEVKKKENNKLVKFKFFLSSLAVLPLVKK